MTKRFTMNEDGYIWDNKEPISQETVLDKLNELHEEKEQLQHDATILIQSNQDYRKENEQLKQSNERIVKDIELALGFIKHKGYSLQDIKDYEDAKKEYEEDLAYYRKGDVE